MTIAEGRIQRVKAEEIWLTVRVLSGNFLTCCLLLFAVVVAPAPNSRVSDRYGH
jgi:hypothetical protein